LPLCAPGQTNDCFNFTGGWQNLNGSYLTNKLVEKNNLIPATSLNLRGDYSNYSNPKYRAVYNTAAYYLVPGSSGPQIKLHPGREANQYYYSDLLDCSDTDGLIKAASIHSDGVFSKATCQSFYGIDIGNFSDNLIIDYQGSTNQQDQRSSSTVSVNYVSPASNNITPRFFFSHIDPQSLNNISVYEKQGQEIVGIVLRANLPEYEKSVSGLTVSECASGSNNFSPCMNVAIKAKGASGNLYSQQAQIISQPFKFPGLSEPAAPVYIAGMSFSAFATDSNNLLSPFFPLGDADVQSSVAPYKLISSKAKVSSNSILGSYIDKPLDTGSNCTWDSCAKYLSGLEVIFGNYVRGGSWFCLNNDPNYDLTYDKDPSQAILTKMINSVSGSSFSNPSILFKDIIEPSPILSLPITGFYTAPVQASPTAYSSSSSSLQQSLADGQVVRSKIGAERPNRCVPIPPPADCPLTNSSDGSSIWCDGSSPCKVGAKITGKCKDGYTPKDPNKMQGYCLMQYANAQYPSVVDYSDINLFAGCVKSSSSSTSATSSAP
jgi:hypothetical protein